MPHPLYIPASRYIYPVFGVFLALLVTIGLSFFQVFFQIPYRIAAPQLFAEVFLQNIWLYLYVFCSNALVNGIVGYNLGWREDYLRTQSITDPLTMLANRRYFTKRLEIEIKRCQRLQMPLALILIDLDRLKHINDHLGHQAGDLAIKTMAKTMQQLCRATDIIARLGGDEFAILAPATNAQQGKELSARLQQVLQHKKIGTCPLTFSMGVVDNLQLHEKFAQNKHPSDKLTCQTLLHIADEALYQAKKQGGNCCVVGEQDPMERRLRSSLSGKKHKEAQS